MPIIPSELVVYKSAIVTDDTSNGGKMSNSLADLVTSGQLNNVWPSVFKAEREAGSRKFRKTFCKNENDDDLTLYFAYIWLDIVTPADDWVTIWEGSQTDTDPATLSATADHYGCGLLVNDLVATATACTVNVEDAELADGLYPIFRNGDKVRITDKVTPDSPTGNEEFVTITTVPTVANVTQVTFSFTPALTNPYLIADGARVMSIIEPASVDIVSTISGVGVSSTSGVFDSATTGNITADNIGSIQETYTITFDDATTFTCRDAAANVIGSGNTSTLFAPMNATFSKPLFSILAAAWSGTWAAAETVTFTTNASAAAIWQMRRVPAAAGSLAGNKTTLVITGESA